ncbi:MAG TPA: peptidoglycan bridge formation glycyltransferase FemA/FemB family protein [Candidatus Saccharimonadales bacterium]
MLQPHFLQSEAWEIFQTNLGRQTFRARGEGWQWLAVLERGHLGSRLHCPYGPTAENTKALQEAVNALRQKALETKVDFIRIEPRAPVTAADLSRLGAFRAARTVQPAHTLQIDLTQSEEALLGAVTSGNRRDYKNPEKHELTFHKSYDPADVELFLHCIHEVAARTGMKPHSDKYFRAQVQTLLPLKAAAILIAHVKGEPAATIIAHDSPTTRYYAHAAAYYRFRSAQPASALICFAMIDAKRQGQQIFDFSGIAPPNEPHHPWAGFTKFKQSFGGHVVDYLGTWEIPLHKGRYRIIRMAHALNSTKRKLAQTRSQKAVF